MEPPQPTMAERSAQDLAERHAGTRRLAVDGIVALNVVVFVAWQVGARVPEVGAFMERHFLVSLTSVEQGRIWTLLTSAFSHAAAWHLIINMFVLKSFAPPIARAWGLSQFLTFYVCAGVSASVAHVLFSWFGWPDIPALGASGAIAGLLLAYAFLYPRRLVYLFAIVPLPAWAMAIAFVGFDLWGLIGQYRERQLGWDDGVLIGHGAHLGGALFGVLWSLVDRSRFDELLSQEQEALDAADEQLMERARQIQKDRMNQRMQQLRKRGDPPAGRQAHDWLPRHGEDDET